MDNGRGKAGGMECLMERRAEARFGRQRGERAAQAGAGDAAPWVVSGE